MSDYRTCSECGQTFPDTIENFAVYIVNGKQYMRRICRPCYREYKKIYEVGRQTHKTGLYAKTINRIQWKKCLDYFNNCCAVCGRPRGFFHTIVMDHWIPLSSPDCPGAVVGNIIPLCHGFEGCNNSKRDSDPIIWLTAHYNKKQSAIIVKRIADYFGQL